MSPIYTIETEREDDGRWIAEVLEIPGVMAYSDTEQDVIVKVKNLAAKAILEWS